MTREEIIDELEMYTVGRLKKDRVYITVEELQKFIDEIKALEQEPRWIPVSERLPKKNVEVLATTVWGAVTIAEMYSANDWVIHEGATNAEIDDIVAWMPLPKPYREVEE